MMKEDLLQPHPAAEIFPLMNGTDYEALVSDIRENGQREPIVIHDGQILDGRNRYRACRELGIEPLTEPWCQTGTPEAYVISMNLHRRHLNESQRAMIAARMATRTAADTQRRFGGDRAVEISTARMSNQEAADLLNVSRASVVGAKKVINCGTPEEVAAAEAGKMAVGPLSRRIAKGESAEKRKKKRAESLSEAGRNPERIQRMQLQAEIWRCLSDGLVGLTSLPLVTDVVEIVAANPARARAVDERLPRALQYLQDLANEWRNRD